MVTDTTTRLGLVIEKEDALLARMADILGPDRASRLFKRIAVKVLAEGTKHLSFEDWIEDSFEACLMDLADAAATVDPDELGRLAYNLSTRMDRMEEECERGY